MTSNEHPTGGDVEAEIRALVERQALEFADMHNPARRLAFAAEMHWFFFEAAAARRDGRYLASVLCAFQGIEATVRWLHREAYPPTAPDLEDVSILSHRLLRDLHASGYKVDTLAFPGETDFLTKIQTNKPYIELLRQRNNIAHGNVAEYFQTVPGTEDRFFTPECLRDLATTLHDITDAWTREIERRRNESATTNSSAPPAPAA
jgi:hypothetical protein